MRGYKKMSENKNMSIVLAVLICTAVIAPAMAQPKAPFLIHEEVLKTDGSPCNSPWVHITNQNTDESWDAKNSSTAGYYQLVLTTDDVSTGDVLKIVVSGSGCPTLTTEYTVTQEELEDGELKTYGYLKPTSLLPTSFTMSVNNTISVTLKNEGPPVGAFDVVLKFGDVPVGTKTVESLNTSEETTLEFAYIPTAQGAFTMTVIVDPGNVTDKLNNNRTIHHMSFQVKVMGSSSGNWASDSAIIAGLSHELLLSAPTVFEKDETVYLISGADDGTFHGYKWAGSTWQQDDAIVSGLGDVGNQSSPAVFCMNETWYLIAGRMHGFNGFKWVGSKWEPEDAIVSGLAYFDRPEVTNYLNKPTVFYKDATWYLISGNMPKWTIGGWEQQIRYLGHKWNGSGWEDHDSIESGLPRRISYSAAPTVFYENEVWYLISGTESGEFMGYSWIDSAWQPDEAQTLGLAVTGTRTTPTVFYKDGTRHLISGAYSGGFFGFRYVPTVKNLPDLMPTSIQPTLLKTNATNNITTTVLNAGNASAGAFNVSLKRDGTVIGTKTLDSLSVGEERSVIFSYIPTSPGLTFNITATVDPENAIEESNATNNNLTVLARTTNTTVHEAFDTGPGTYPSIAGTHYGKIIPEQDITVNKTYTYPCAGTGGHSEYVKIWDETTGVCVVAEWDGYSGDYHNLSFNRTQTLREGVVYSYIIETGSYPQIIHDKQLSNGNITCTRFEDANGRVYHNRLPAIRLFYE